MNKRFPGRGLFPLFLWTSLFIIGCGRPLIPSFKTPLVSCPGLFHEVVDPDHLRLLGECGKSASEPSGKVKMFDIATGTELFQFDNFPVKHRCESEAPGFLLAKDKIFGTDCYSQIELRDSETGILLRTLSFPVTYIRGITGSADSEFVLFETVGANTLFKVLDKTGEEILTIPGGSAQFLPEPDRIVSVDQDGKTLRIWSISQKRQLMEEAMPLLSITDAAHFTQWKFLAGYRVFIYSCQSNSVTDPSVGSCRSQMWTYGPMGRTMLFEKQWDVLGIDSRLGRSYTHQVFVFSHRGDLFTVPKGRWSEVSLLDGFTGEERQRIPMDFILPIGFTPDDTRLLFLQGDSLEASHRLGLKNVRGEERTYLLEPVVCQYPWGNIAYNPGTWLGFSSDSSKLYTSISATNCDFRDPVNAIGVWDLTGL